MERTLQNLRCKKSNLYEIFPGMGRSLTINKYYQVIGPSSAGNKQLFIINNSHNQYVTTLDSEQVEQFFYSLAEEREIKINTLDL